MMRLLDDRLLNRGEFLMSLAANGITALVTLLAVLLGGWLTIKNQDRLWRRDHARQWRDIRLSVYRELLSATREYIAFALEPTAQITAVPHPRKPGLLMPFFDDSGRPYKEKLEAAASAVKLVSELPETLDALYTLVRRARIIAAARAECEPGTIPSQDFQQFWAAEQMFLDSVRCELGLAVISRHEPDAP